MESLVADSITPRPTGLRWLLRGWPLSIVLATLLGAWQGLNHLIGMRDTPMLEPWKPFLWEMSSVLIIVALVPVIVRVERHFRLDSRPRGRIVLVHLLSAVVFSILHTAGMVAVRKLVYALAGSHYDFGDVLVGGFYEMQKDLVTYVLVLLVVFAMREFQERRVGERRALRLNADLSEARLRHLTTQIEPHFLFNALNAISNRMREDVDAADRMITQLGDLLRAAYDTGDQPLVPLSRELEWLRGYAAMMAERYRGQLSFELDVEPGLDAVAVPRLMLQPIVENALRHGLGDGRGTLAVKVRREGARLRYTISDDGVGFSSTKVTLGTGLSNVSRRLELLFPSDHELAFSLREPRGTMVVVAFPVAA